MDILSLTVGDKITFRNMEVQITSISIVNRTTFVVLDGWLKVTLAELEAGINFKAEVNGGAACPTV